MIRKTGAKLIPKPPPKSPPADANKVSGPGTSAVAETGAAEEVSGSKAPDVSADGFAGSAPAKAGGGRIDRQRAARVVQELAQNVTGGDERVLLGRLQALMEAPQLGKSEALLVTDLVDQASPEVRRGLQEAFGPMGDLLYSTSADELLGRRDDIKAFATKVKTFRSRLENCVTLDALKGLEKDFREELLPGRCRNELLKAFMDVSTDDGANWAAAATCYENAVKAQPSYGSDEIGSELHIVCLNKAGRLEDSVTAAKALIQSNAVHDGAGPFHVDTTSVRDQPRLNGEVLAGLGKAFYLISQAAGKGEITDRQKAIIDDELGAAPAGGDYEKAALDISTRYYEAGFATDFEYYPGIVSVYNNYERGDAERAEQLAPLALAACERAGGVESDDYWCLSTQMELALITRSDDLLGALVPKVLEKANVDWMLSSSLDKMSTLCADREQAGEDTGSLKFVIGLLSDRIGELKAHGQRLKACGSDEAQVKAEKAAAADHTEQWLGDVLPQVEQQFGPRSTTLEGAAGRQQAERAKATEAIFSSSADFRAMTSSHALGGTVAYGGQVPDMTVTRDSARIVGAMLQEWGMDKVADFSTFNAVVNDKLNKMLDLQDASGRRPLEDLHSPEHEVLDNFDQKRLRLAETPTSGDSRTDLLAIMGLGVGDCRPTAFAKQLLFDVWQSQRTNQLMGDAFDKSTAGDSQGAKACMAEVSKLQRQQLRTVSVRCNAPIQMNDVYDMKTDGQGRPLADPNGEFQLVENHTFNILVELEDDGLVGDKVQAADAFYQEVYPLDGLQMKATDILRDEGFRGSIMGLKNDRGEDIPFTLKPAAHSGSLLKPFDVGSSDFFFCGQTVGISTLASVLHERPRMNGLARAIADLDV